MIIGFVMTRSIVILTILLHCASMQAISCATYMPNDKIFMSKKKTESTGKTEWKAKTKGYEKYIFYHGKNIQADYIITSRELCDYIGTNHGSDPLNSMLQNKIVIEDMEKPVIFESEEAMKKALPSYNDQ